MKIDSREEALKIAVSLVGWALDGQLPEKHFNSEPVSVDNFKQEMLEFFNEYMDQSSANREE